MIEIIIGSLISFIITFFLLPILIRVAINKKIFVIRHYRTVHQQDTSSLGGIAIFSGVLFVMLFLSDFISIQEIKYYIAAGSFIFLVGLRDDLHHVKPLGKLFGQLIAAAIIIFLGKFRIESLDFIQSDNLFSYWPSVLLTFFIVVWFINAYNLFDGIDLQATLVAIVILIPTAAWFYLAKQSNFSLLLFATSAALIAFIFFNYSPSKIFMGDTGTVTIGFILAFSFIKFINLNNLTATSEIQIHHPFLFGLFVFQLPLFDSVRVGLVRILRKKSPFKADKNHFHHLLLSLNWSHHAIAIFSATYTLILIIINLLLFIYITNIWLIILVNLTIISLLYLNIIYRLKKIKHEIPS